MKAPFITYWERTVNQMGLTPSFEEIVMEAVQVNGLALWDADETLKADREILASCRWG